jgi:hypothetical protein
MDLSRIENNLKKAYENLTWEERKNLMDNVHNSFKKGEIPLEEFETLLVSLKNSCPMSDAWNMVRYGINSMVDLSRELTKAYMRERVSKCIFQAIALESQINFAVFYGAIKSEGNDGDLGDGFISENDKMYEQVKAELFGVLRQYGLTKEQEDKIITMGIADSVELIAEIMNSNEPDFTK